MEYLHVIISFYMDDMLIFGSNIHVINETKKKKCLKAILI